MDASKLNIYSVLPKNIIPFQVIAERFVIKTDAHGRDKALFYVEDELVNYFLEPEMVTLDLDVEEFDALGDTEVDEE
ncbi:hypothetical protein [Bremerella sp. P1]|uniref:hypothetical protein n=1 Tax=Bremerella sp. P1 TaxID=3026424 RepID=UPI00236846EA|nr:hypothetical protein [Bremerella sp. P1]WDI44787.1 hypothetical protein PSR63_12660 [Bremerella sp. P1]